MKPVIVADCHIPYLQGMLDREATVRYLDPSLITLAAVKDADAIITRTRTYIGRELLQGSRCRMVATATIGTDHIDMDWCREHGIKVANVPGCNAPAVAQYVFAALGHMINRPIAQHTIAIVGAGHVGSIVERWARALDMRVILIDPPRQRAEGGAHWHTLAQAAEQADIITFHTPLIKNGSDATFHLAGQPFFNSLRRRPIIINTSRGSVVDNSALSAALKEGKVRAAAIDVWENEPHLSGELLDLCTIATPHIAGYSLDGKVRATAGAVKAVAEHLGITPEPIVAPEPLAVPAAVRMSHVLQSYDPTADTQALRSDISAFETLRNNYPLRREVTSTSPD